MSEPKVCRKVKRLYDELEERIQNFPIGEIEIRDGTAVLRIHHHAFGKQIILEETVYDKEGNEIGVAFPSCTKQLKLLRQLKKKIKDVRE